VLLLKTSSLIWHFATHLPGGLSDPLFVSWIIAWDLHALATDPLNLFNANIFYPVQNTLVLSEHMIAGVPIFAPTYLLTGNLIFSYNTVFLLPFLFSGLTMFPGALLDEELFGRVWWRRACLALRRFGSRSSTIFSSIAFTEHPWSSSSWTSLYGASAGWIWPGLRYCIGCRCWHKEPERFTTNPYHHTLGLNT
jgi:hypothetical protein